MMLKNSPTQRYTLVALSAVILWTATLSAQVGDNPDVLNPNLASRTELAALPGVDEILAKTLFDGRPYLDMESFDQALSATIDTTTRGLIYPSLFVPINLNQASREEILLVPGVGPRMAHEFEEYRPYRGLAEFHREIGKYVDDDEVARLAKFVFVPLDPNQATETAILTVPGANEELWQSISSSRPHANLEALGEALSENREANEVQRLLRYFSIKPSS